MTMDATEGENGASRAGVSGRWQRLLNNRHAVILTATAIGALGVMAGGWFAGSGLVRMKDADRAVTVRGLAERDVTADLATWSLNYSATAPDLASAQAQAASDTAAVRAYFADLGFPANAISPAGVSVSSFTDNGGAPRFTVQQRLQFRTTDIARAQRAVARQFDLVARGVALDGGSSMQYSFTGLNAIKPPMISEATRDARRVAEQFARDSGTSVGGIRSATQGYFEVNARDDGGDEYGAADTPNKRVRVVTTVVYYLN